MSYRDRDRDSDRGEKRKWQGLDAVKRQYQQRYQARFGIGYTPTSAWQIESAETPPKFVCHVTQQVFHSAQAAMICLRSREYRDHLRISGLVENPLDIAVINQWQSSADDTVKAKNDRKFLMKVRSIYLVLSSLLKSILPRPRPTWVERLENAQKVLGDPPSFKGCSKAMDKYRNALDTFKRAGIPLMMQLTVGDSNWFNSAESLQKILNEHMKLFDGSEQFQSAKAAVAPPSSSSSSVTPTYAYMAVLEPAALAYWANNAAAIAATSASATAKSTAAPTGAAAAAAAKPPPLPAFTVPLPKEPKTTTSEPDAKKQKTDAK